MPTAEVEEAQDEAFYRPSKPQRVIFTPEQQKVFDRAFAKRERKLRVEFDAMRKDLFETVALTGQLLERCSDRISLSDQRAIRSGLNAICLEYEEHSKCQKAQ